MKKLLLSVVCLALAVVWGGYSVAQAQTGDLKPSFISFTPGQYVHGWPAFTVSYPKEWPTQPTMPGENLRAAPPRQGLPPSPALVVAVNVPFAPLSDMTKIWIGYVSQMGKDFNVIYDKPSKLADGTPVQEAEIEWTAMNGPKINSFLLAAKKDVTWIWVSIHHDQGKIAEDLKGIVRSLKLLPDQEKPVAVPEDVQAFLNQFLSDIVSRDIDKIMAHYSDNLLHTGFSKGMIRGWYMGAPDNPTKRSGGVTWNSATVTVFEPHGDKAYIDGFWTEKCKDDPTPVMPLMTFQQIIKENGQWKWYGNQK